MVIRPSALRPALAEPERPVRRFAGSERRDRAGNVLGAWDEKRETEVDRMLNTGRVGFEPTVPKGTSVFKTDAFDHSATYLSELKTT